MSGTLLAVDLGLRTGFALYGQEGRLLRHGSSHFPSRSALRSAARALVSEAEDLQWLVAEGPGDLARPWLREARRRGAQTMLVAAEDWRPALLLPRERRSGRQAKSQAERLALQIMRAAHLPCPTPPGHDAAEAILLGAWALARLGWGEGWVMRPREGSTGVEG